MEALAGKEASHSISRILKHAAERHGRHVARLHDEVSTLAASLLILRRDNESLKRSFLAIISALLDIVAATAQVIRDVSTEIDPSSNNAQSSVPRGMCMSCRAGAYREEMLIEKIAQLQAASELHESEIAVQMSCLQDLWDQTQTHEEILVSSSISTPADTVSHGNFNRQDHLLGCEIDSHNRVSHSIERSHEATKDRKLSDLDETLSNQYPDASAVSFKISASKISIFEDVISPKKEEAVRSRMKETEQELSVDVGRSPLRSSMLQQGRASGKVMQRSSSIRLIPLEGL